MKALEIPGEADLGRLYHGFYDDFRAYVSADEWTVVATDSGGAVLQDETGGVLLLDASDGTVGDNDEVYLHTTKEQFLFEADAPLIFECLVKFTEANTDDANIMIGLANAVAADHLVDNGAGPLADYSGACFFKVDGGTTWSVENSDSTTQKTTNLDGTSYINSKVQDAQTAGGAWELLRIEWRPKTGSVADVLFWKDRLLVAKHSDQAYANATELAVMFGVKNGDTNEETLKIDYAFCYQKRTNLP